MLCSCSVGLGLLRKPSRLRFGRSFVKTFAFSLCLNLKSKQTSSVGKKQPEGLTDAQLKKWIKDNCPKTGRHIHVSYFLDKLDLWYLVNHHPQKKEVAEDEYRFLADYVFSNYTKLFEGMIGCDYDNEYQVKKRYLFTLFVGDEKKARVYRMTLNNAFQDELPENDNFELYLKRLN